jgi:hypothetical protein
MLTAMGEADEGAARSRLGERGLSARGQPESRRASGHAHHLNVRFRHSCPEQPDRRAFGGQARGQAALGIGLVPGVGQLRCAEGAMSWLGQKGCYVCNGQDFDGLRDDIVTVVVPHTPV